MIGHGQDGRATSVAALPRCVLVSVWAFDLILPWAGRIAFHTSPSLELYIRATRDVKTILLYFLPAGKDFTKGTAGDELTVHS